MGAPFVSRRAREQFSELMVHRNEKIRITKLGGPQPIGAFQ